MSSRRRIRDNSKADITVEQVIIGGGTGPDVLYVEDVEASDTPALDFTLRSEEGVARDTLSPLRFDLASEAGSQSDLAPVGVEGHWPSEGTTSAGGLIEIRNLRDMADAWTDEGNPDTNHGSDPDLQVQQSVVLAQEGFRGYMLWDLSKMVGFTEDPSATDITIEMHLSPPAVDVAASLTIRGDVFDTQPWTETGLTWNNQPEHANVYATYEYPLLAGAGTVSFPLPGVTVSDILGKWLSVYATFEALVAVVGSFTIRARENAQGPHPNISFNAVLL